METQDTLDWYHQDDTDWDVIKEVLWGLLEFFRWRLNSLATTSLFTSVKDIAGTIVWERNI